MRTEIVYEVTCCEHLQHIIIYRSREGINDQFARFFSRACALASYIALYLCSRELSLPYTIAGEHSQIGDCICCNGLLKLKTERGVV